jgi:hypothetical protein
VGALGCVWPVVRVASTRCRHRRLIDQLTSLGYTLVDPGRPFDSQPVLAGQTSYHNKGAGVSLT